MLEMYSGSFKFVLSDDQQKRLADLLDEICANNDVDYDMVALTVEKF